jgi:multicomponent Na+:H+ antiporter subunit E
VSAAIRLPALVIWLVLLWMGLWGQFTWANLFGGIAVAVGVLLVAARATGTAGLHPSTVRPLGVLRFAGYFLVQLVKANLILAWEIVTPHNRINTGIIGVPVRGLSDSLITLVANAVTLTPGTVTVEVRREPQPMVYVHVLHLHDIEAVRREVLHLEALAVKAFGSDEALALLRAEEAS